jgi:ComF family protein
MMGFIELFLPIACPLCGAGTGSSSPHALCSGCRDDILPLAAPQCPRCALPYPTENGSDHLCEHCLRNDPPFTRVHGVGVYEGSLRDGVHRFKYHGGIHLDRALGYLLASAVGTSEKFDLIVPVPLHPSRLRERTYNQSLLLAAVVGRKLRVPVAPRLLRRIRPTQPQQGLEAAVRKRNLRGAFSLEKELSGERILLIDDVLTTGATASECSRILRGGGAAEVVVAVIGRARRHHI